MRKFCGVPLVVPTILCGLMSAWLATTSLHGQPAEQDAREQIGEVFGRPVFRDEIRTDEGFQVRDELHRLFTTPVLQKYRQQHKAEIEPTEAELVAVAAYFDKKHGERIGEQAPELRERLKEVEAKLGGDDLAKEQREKLEFERTRIRTQLDPPGRFFAMFIHGNWKFQKHLYERYGGGRVLWQQAGMEAFDAYHAWLTTHEKQGDFVITDPKLRSTFYEYWTTMNHGSFLTADPKRIRSEFLQPPWMPEPPAQR